MSHSAESRSDPARLLPPQPAFGAGGHGWRGRPRGHGKRGGRRHARRRGPDRVAGIGGIIAPSRTGGRPRRQAGRPRPARPRHRAQDRRAAQADDAGREAGPAAAGQHRRPRAGRAEERAGRRPVQRHRPGRARRGPAPGGRAHPPRHPADLRAGRHPRLRHQLPDPARPRPAAGTPSVGFTDARVVRGRGPRQRSALDVRADDGRHPRAPLGPHRRGRRRGPLPGQPVRGGEGAGLPGRRLLGPRQAGRLHEALRRLRRHRGRARLQHRRRLDPAAAQPVPAAVPGRRRAGVATAMASFNTISGRARARQRATSCATCSRAATASTASWSATTPASRSSSSTAWSATGAARRGPASPPASTWRWSAPTTSHYGAEPAAPPATITQPADRRRRAPDPAHQVPPRPVRRTPTPTRTKAVTDDQRANAKATRDAAGRSMVLLQNEAVGSAPVLPLGPSVHTVAADRPAGPGDHRPQRHLGRARPGSTPPVTIEQGLAAAPARP